jgi:hypothetical protein
MYRWSSHWDARVPVGPRRTFIVVWIMRGIRVRIDGQIATGFRHMAHKRLRVGTGCILGAVEINSLARIVHLQR